jgi:hypothetical protein
MKYRMARWVFSTLTIILSTNLQLVKMSRSIFLALFTAQAVLGLEQPNGVGRLPALGWNSWVGQIRNYFALEGY